VAEKKANFRKMLRVIQGVQAHKKTAIQAVYLIWRIADYFPTQSDGSLMLPGYFRR
jgi:hypothetical protein